MKLRQRYFMMMLVLIALTFAHQCMAEARVDMRGDLAGYVQAKLPLPGPMMVFAYHASGALAGVVSISGEKANDRLHELETAMATTRFSGFGKPSTALEDASFKQFLSDQGYETGQWLDAKAAYTLVVVVMRADGAACESIRDMQRHYLQAINRAVGPPARPHTYAIATLALDSTSVGVKCKQ